MRTAEDGCLVRYPMAWRASIKRMPVVVALLVMLLVGCQSSSLPDVGSVDARISYHISTPAKKCKIGEPLPLDLTVTNGHDCTIYFLDFGDVRNVEPLPVLSYSCNRRSCPWDFGLPLASGTPEPIPTKRGVRGAWSIVELPPGETYRVRFPNIVTPEVRSMVEEQGLPSTFTISYRWTKSVWLGSRTYPIVQSEASFLSKPRQAEPYVVVEFMP